MRKLFLIYGGKSEEHDISLLTAKNVSNVLDYTKYVVHPIYIQKDGTWISGETMVESATDVAQLKFETTGQIVLPSIVKEEGAIAFPLLHGPNGEDGTIQGLFEMMGIAYVGAGVLASATGMDKIISKKIFAHEGIPQLPFVEVFKRDWLSAEDNIIQTVEATLSYPVFVKPANLGSSVGISKATNTEELVSAITLALSYDRRVVVEKGIIAREVEVAVLGNDDVKASVVGEVVKSVDFYDFNEKYVNNTVTLQIPAEIDSVVSEKIRNAAIKAYKALDCTGLTRCDFFLTEDNSIYINEVNTLPGFTQFSMYPLLWEESGLSYDQLVETLIQLAIDRFEEKNIYQKIK